MMEGEVSRLVKKMHVLHLPSKIKDSEKIARYQSLLDGLSNPWYDNSYTFVDIFIVFIR